MTKKEQKEKQRVQNRIQELKDIQNVIKEKADVETNIQLRDELWLTWDTLCFWVYNMEKYGQEMRPIGIYDENGRRTAEYYDNGKIVELGEWDGNFRELY